eukprot:scaffold119109_cov68-Phaeocystis_antarctica.AAC.11
MARLAEAPEATPEVEDIVSVEGCAGGAGDGEGDGGGLGGAGGIAHASGGSAAHAACSAPYACLSRSDSSSKSSVRPKKASLPHWSGSALGPQPARRPPRSGSHAPPVAALAAARTPPFHGSSIHSNTMPPTVAQPVAAGEISAAHCSPRCDPCVVSFAPPAVLSYESRPNSESSSGLEVYRPGLALCPVALERVHIERRTRRLQAGDVPEFARHRHRDGVPRAQRVLRAAHRGCQLSDLSVLHCRLRVAHAVHLLIGHCPHEQRRVTRRLLDDVGQGSWVVVEVVGDTEDHAKSAFGARVEEAEVAVVETWIPVVHPDHVGAERCDAWQIACPNGPVRLVEDIGRRGLALRIAF